MWTTISFNNIYRTKAAIRAGRCLCPVYIVFSVLCIDPNKISLKQEKKKARRIRKRIEQESILAAASAVVFVRGYTEESMPLFGQAWPGAGERREYFARTRAEKGKGYWLPAERDHAHRDCCDGDDPCLVRWLQSL